MRTCSWVLLSRIQYASLMLAAFACGPAPLPEPPGVDEQDWEPLCGERCAGAPVQVQVGDGYSCIRYAGGAVLCWGIRRGVPDDSRFNGPEGGGVGIPGITQWPQIVMPEGIDRASAFGGG